MKILAVVPARGGSKRVPGKNYRLLGGKPLINWSIDVAKNIPEICDVLVSTDDEIIAEISQQAGALVPWLRPTKLATDNASSVDVVLHALDWYEEQNGVIDGVLLLQPTSPFRTLGTTRKAIQLYKENKHLPVLGVSPTDAHPMWALKVENNKIMPFMCGDGFKMRSQDLPEAYIVNGAIYLISPEQLRSEHAFITKNTIPLVVECAKESLDIDTEWDWNIATFIVSQLKVLNEIKKNN